MIIVKYLDPSHDTCLVKCVVVMDIASSCLCLIEVCIQLFVWLQYQYSLAFLPL